MSRGLLGQALADIEETDDAVNQHFNATDASDAVSVFEDIAAALRGDSEFGMLSADTIMTLDLVAAAAYTILAALQDNEAQDRGCADRRTPDLDRGDSRQIAELFADMTELAVSSRNDRCGLRLLLGFAGGWVAAHWRTAAVRAA